jgi:hypothetical protein
VTTHIGARRFRFHDHHQPLDVHLDLHVLDTTDAGVKVTLGAEGDAFWIPRGPPVRWATVPEPGVKVVATMPRWLAIKHNQVRESRVNGQRVLNFHQHPELDPEKSTATGSFPMSDFPPDAGRGALYRNTKAEKPSHPSHTGFADIDGKRYRIAAWVRVKEDGSGEKFFSLSFRPADEQPQQQRPRPESMPAVDAEIPF